jgi:hypothetical protein
MSKMNEAEIKGLNQRIVWAFVFNAEFYKKFKEPYQVFFSNLIKKPGNEEPTKLIIWCRYFPDSKLRSIISQENYRELVKTNIDAKNFKKIVAK